MNAKKPIGFRRNRETDEKCGNKKCESKPSGFYPYMYLNRARGVEKWVCFNCAKNVDKII